MKIMKKRGREQQLPREIGRVKRRCISHAIKNVKILAANLKSFIHSFIHSFKTIPKIYIQFELISMQLLKASEMNQLPSSIRIKSTGFNVNGPWEVSSSWERRRRRKRRRDTSVMSLPPPLPPPSPPLLCLKMFLRKEKIAFHWLIHRKIFLLLLLRLLHRRRRFTFNLCHKVEELLRRRATVSVSCVIGDGQWEFSS